ncbi:regulator of microtubule dynamics protein 1 [Parasteatoda tepidariorum]|uniref:regulator of microtubule dynamics protein 1 n=1 Tax=Parasteatoda tepidariorum TaxID=114398 RepID=UPI00077FA2A8|nr:regulator of microtubule dynamics protein 1 [Parasteatoda tepidariorum]
MDALLRAERIGYLAALGAGVVLGISGIYHYFKTNRCVTRELHQLSGTIDSLRREIEELKSSASFRSENITRSPIKKSHLVNSSTPPSKYYSYTSSIDDEEEYFDFTDTEEIEGAWASINGSREELHKDNVEALFEELDSLLDNSSTDKVSVYNKIFGLKDEYMDNANFLWRLAKATHLYGIVVQSQDDTEKRKELAYEAYEYAKKAYELVKDNPEVHKWYAITIGSLGDYVGVQERIINGYTFKEHVDKAITLKPQDPSLHYMLGRWCYEVATLPWYARKIASTLLTAPPESTLEEARTYLFQADRLKPDWKENLLVLAKTYIKDGSYSEAISTIDRALLIPVKGEDDEINHKELESLEKQYNTYRNS